MTGIIEFSSDTLNIEVSGINNNIPVDLVEVISTGQDVYINVESAQGVLAVNGRQGFVILNKSDVGLSNVENVSITGASGYLQYQINNLDTGYASQAEIDLLSGLLAQTGAFLDTRINRLSGNLISTGANLQSQINNLYGSGFITGVDFSAFVYTTGNQTISGDKNFVGQNLSFGGATKLITDGDFLYIETNGRRLLDTEEVSLFDYDGKQSISWNSRELRNRSGITNLNWEDPQYVGISNLLVAGTGIFNNIPTVNGTGITVGPHGKLHGVSQNQFGNYYTGILNINDIKDPILIDGVSFYLYESPNLWRAGAGIYLRPPEGSAGYIINNRPAYYLLGSSNNSTTIWYDSGTYNNWVQGTYPSVQYVAIPNGGAQTNTNYPWQVEADLWSGRNDGALWDAYVYQADLSTAINYIGYNGLANSPITVYSISGADKIVYITGNQTVSGTKSFSGVVNINSGTFLSRPTVNGTGVLLSGEAASLPTTILYTTGNQIKSGRLIIGDDAGSIVDPNSPYTLSLQTNSPATWLEILNNSGANKGVFFGIQDNDFEQYNWQGGDIKFFTSQNPSDGTVRLTIKNDGKVGIGTNSPSEKLEVAGNIKVTNSGFFASGIKVGNNSIIITENRIDGGYKASSGILTDGLLGIQYSGYFDSDPEWFKTATLKPIINELILTGPIGVDYEALTGTYVKVGYQNNQGTSYFQGSNGWMISYYSQFPSSESYWYLHPGDYSTSYFTSSDLITWTIGPEVLDSDPPTTTITQTQNFENSTAFNANRALSNDTSWEWIGYFVPQITEDYNFYLYADEVAYFWIGDKALNGYTTGNADLVNNSNVQNLLLNSGQSYPVRLQWGHPSNPTNLGIQLGYQIPNLSFYSYDWSGVFFHGSVGKGFYIDAVSGDASFAGNIQANSATFNTRPTVNGTGVLLSGESSNSNIGKIQNIQNSTGVTLDCETYDTFVVQVSEPTTFTYVNFQEGRSINVYLVADHLGHVQHTFPADTTFAELGDDNTIYSFENYTTRILLQKIGEQVINFSSVNITPDTLFNFPAYHTMTVDSTITDILADYDGSYPLYPTFNPSIKNYCVETNDSFNTEMASWSITVNGDKQASNLNNSINANDLVKVTDGTNSYFIRFLPSEIGYITPEIPATGNYHEGYYQAAFYVESYYYYIFDKNGVPLWYYTDGTSPLSLHRGNNKNRVVTNSWQNETRAILEIKNKYITGSYYNPVNDSDGNPVSGPYVWDNHEAQELVGPPNRRGNFLAGAYTDDGFYFQEQNATGGLVWDWYSSECFTDTDTERYHWNSIDVNPINGDIISSLRHTSSIICIDYTTKNVKWVLQGSNPFGNFGSDPQPLENFAYGSRTANTKWIDGANIIGEPEYGGEQYNGTCAQHDARYHTNITPIYNPNNVIISIFDDQTANFPYSRGVIYEIDETSGVAYHRFSIFSDDENNPSLPQAGFMGSYTVLKENDNSYSHVLTLVGSNVSVLEYNGAIIPANDYNTADKVLALDTSSFTDNIYRFIKVPMSQLNINNLRNTAGLALNTEVSGTYQNLTVDTI